VSSIGWKSGKCNGSHKVGRAGEKPTGGIALKRVDPDKSVRLIKVTKSDIGF
jgi:hypothetical protein